MKCHSGHKWGHIIDSMPAPCVGLLIAVKGTVMNQQGSFCPANKFMLLIFIKHVGCLLLSPIHARVEIYAISSITFVCYAVHTLDTHVIIKKLEIYDLGLDRQTRQTHTDRQKRKNGKNWACSFKNQPLIAHHQMQLAAFSCVVYVM